jgi:branched-chain amino acid transport system substrate-binding protein
VSNSGPFAGAAEELDRGICLYIRQHEKDLPPGVKLEIVRRDDTGPNPEVAKRMAQELIARNHVQLLAGTVYTSNALAVAPPSTEAEIPCERGRALPRQCDASLVFSHISARSSRRLSAVRCR